MGKKMCKMAVGVGAEWLLWGGGLCFALVCPLCAWFFSMDEVPYGQTVNWAKGLKLSNWPKSDLTENGIKVR
jgi:hypothetical protein